MYILRGGAGEVIWCEAEIPNLEVTMGPMTAPRGPRGTHTSGLLGLGLLVVSFALGAALHHNVAGTPLDRWFQRATSVGARRPGAPGFHHRLYLVLTRSTEVGTFPVLLYFAAAVLAVLIWIDAPTRQWTRTKHNVWLAGAPLVALAVAAGSAEKIVKPMINRRMAGNLGVLTYPSVHAVATAAVASAAIAVLFQLRGDSRTRGWRWVVAGPLIAVVPLGVGLDMAVIRSHFLTDVIGGWAWGCGWGLLTAAAFGRGAPLRRHRGDRTPSRVSAG
jgi:membrane-associated phospholipid phosphatase